MVKKKIWRIIFISCIAYFGLDLKAEQKPIVVIIPSYNNVSWCQKNLSSVLAQTYDNFRVIYIDDCSTDGTGQLVEQWLAQYDKVGRVHLIKNKYRKGALANYWYAGHLVEDNVIIVHMDGDDWFAHEHVLERINEIYQNPHVWMTYGSYAVYPGYQRGHCRPTPDHVVINDSWRTTNQELLILLFSHLRTFYAKLFKKIKLTDLLVKNIFYPVSGDAAFMYPMLEMAQYHVRFIPDILYIYNQETSLNDYKNNLQLMLTLGQYIKSQKPYEPLKELFDGQDDQSTLVDLIIFSYDRPLQLYALLQSIQRYISGLNKIHILYRTSNEQFEAAYTALKNEFASMNFERQVVGDSNNFYELTLRLLDSCEKYVLFSVDDIVVKDFINIADCIHWMEKTHAYGFFMRLGKNITNSYYINNKVNQNDIPCYLDLNGAICAWQFKWSKLEWQYPNTLDMTMYRTQEIVSVIRNISFQGPNSLEGQWYGTTDFHGIGLCFASSKVVNIPLNMVQDDPCCFKNPHRINMSKYQLLTLFNEGYRIDINPLHQFNNDSPHIDYLPTFTKVILSYRE